MLLQSNIGILGQKMTLVTFNGLLWWQTKQKVFTNHIFIQSMFVPKTISPNFILLRVDLLGKSRNSKMVANFFALAGIEQILTYSGIGDPMILTLLLSLPFFHAPLLSNSTMALCKVDTKIANGITRL